MLSEGDAVLTSRAPLPLYRAIGAASANDKIALHLSLNEDLAVSFGAC